MANNLPAVLSPNETFALTLRNILAGNAQSGNPLMEIRKMSSGFNNNGSEGFLGGKKTKMVIDALTKAVLNIEAGIEAIEKGINKLVDKDDEAEKRLPAKTNVSEKINKSMSDVNGKKYFEAESEADAQKKREVKQVTLLESILKQLSGGAGGFGGGRKGKYEDDGSSDFLGGLTETFLGTGLAMKVGSIGKKILGAGSMLFKGALRFIALPATLIAGIYGAIWEAESITGEKSLEGITGFAKRIGAGISNAISFITFGWFDDKEIYKFITESVPKNALIAFNWVKGEVLSSLEMFDEQMGTNIKKRYEKLTKGLSDMLGLINFGDVAGEGKDGKTDGFFQSPIQTIKSLSSSAYTGLRDGVGNAINNLISEPQMGVSGKQLELAKAANERAVLMNAGTVKETKGHCATGVTTILEKAGITDPLTGGRITGHAYQLQKAFEENAKLQSLGSGRYDYENIPDKPGMLTVYGRGNAERAAANWKKNPQWLTQHKKEAKLFTKPDGTFDEVAFIKNFSDPFGHVGISTGKGKEISDHIQTIEGSRNRAKRFGRPFGLFAPKGDISSGGAISNVLSLAKDTAMAAYQSGKDLIDANKLNLSMATPTQDAELLSRLTTTKTQDTKIKQLASESAKANKVPVEIKYSEPQAPVIINNNTTTSNMPTDTSTSFIDSMDLMMIKILSPIRKF